jgi:hypothetical protein
MSTLQTKGRELAGKAGPLEVSTVELSARKAAKLGGMITGHVEPVFQKLPRDASMQSDLSALLPALGALFRSLDETAYDDLLLAVFQSTTATVDGRRIELFHDQRKRALENIDAAFGADLKLLFTAAAFVVEVNFGDFIAAVRGAIQSVMPRAAVTPPTAG